MIRKLIKKIFGASMYKKMAMWYKRIESHKYYKFQRKSKIELEDSWAYIDFLMEDENVFFGYYDIQQLDKEEEKLLVHVVPKGAETYETAAKIGYFNINNNRFYQITESKAWCWQQGSRLRWYKDSTDKIVVNNVSNNRYVSQVWDISSETSLCIKEICMPLYDIDRNFDFGLSLNFSRLQRLRPGYGYSSLPDETLNDNAPENDGVFLVNLKDNTYKLLVSLAKLAEVVDKESVYEHYVNHISISPNGKKFIFFHIWNNSKNVRLYVCDLDGSNLRLLEDTGRVSHYDWYNNEKVLVTKYEDNICKYILYEINGDKKRDIGLGKLDVDGHPSFEHNGNKFISDTYPLKYNQQELFEYDMEKNKKNTIAKLYSSFSKEDEKRCDLHPRLSSSNRYISVDTTVDGLRKVILFGKR